MSIRMRFIFGITPESRRSHIERTIESRRGTFLEGLS